MSPAAQNPNITPAFTLYFGFVITAQIIGMLSSIFLLWLINDNKFENIFSICVFGMTISLFIFAFTGSLLLSLKYSSLNQNYDDYSIAWITILRMCVCNIAYFLSSYLSFSVYHIIVYQKQLDLKNKKYRLWLGVVITTIFIPYLILASIEFYSNNKKQLLYYQSLDISLQYNFYSRFLLIFYNFLNYFICNYYVDKLYGGNNKNESNPKTIAIRTLVKRMRLYPLFQFVSFIVEFIRCVFYGFRNANLTSFSDAPSYVAFAIIAEILFYLDAFFMLVVYVVMTPGAIIKIKQAFLITDEFGNSIGSTIETTNTNITSVAQSKSEALADQVDRDTDAEFSSYRDSDIYRMNDTKLTSIIAANSNTGRNSLAMTNIIRSTPINSTHISANLSAVQDYSRGSELL